MNSLALPVAVLLALVVSCRGPTSSGEATPDATYVQVSSASLGDTVRIALGHEVNVPNAGFSVKFDEVLSDSRCPHDVTCVWAGSTRVRLVLTPNGGTVQEIELESNLDPRSISIAGHVVRLLPDMEPLAGTTGVYIIRITVTKQ